MGENVLLCNETLFFNGKTIWNALEKSSQNRLSLYLNGYLSELRVSSLPTPDLPLKCGNCVKRS